MKSSKSISITPFLIVNSGVKAMEFYKKAFGAIVLEKYEMPDGKLSARMGIEGAEFCIGDEEAEFNNFSPTTIGGSAVRIVIITHDVDVLFTKALEAGATQICPVTMEDSWKIGKLKDLFGHIWEIGHPLEG
jgi:PhnB protein